MISIYNESRTPWGLKILNNKVNCFFKEKTYKRKNVEKIVKKSVHILAYTTLFENELDMSKYVSMDAVEKLSDKNTTIIFSKKDFNPFITEKAEPVKDILLLTISLKGRKIVDISNENIFILEGFILGGELNMIASINDLTKPLNITLYDETRDEYDVYSFSSENGLCKSSYKLNENNDDKKQFRLRTFRPARPTYTILTYPQDIEKLQTIVDFNNHNVVEINNKNINEVTDNLLDQNYKAVTLFIDSEQFDDNENKIYGGMIKNLFYKKNGNKSFKIINLLLNTKRIIKRKKF